MLKIDKKSDKKIDVYYIGYITMKSISDYENINSANPLYFIADKVDGYIEESNGNKYLVFASTDENKEVLAKYTELWNGIKKLIKTTNGGEEGKYKKISWRSNSTQMIIMSLNKLSNVHMLTAVNRSIFEEDGQYYPNIFFRHMFLSVIKMLEYNRIDVSADIAINKADEKK